jgi:hypothetical protein
VQRAGSRAEDPASLRNHRSSTPASVSTGSHCAGFERSRNELGEETRSQITRSMALTLAKLSESTRPMIESLTATVAPVLPVIQQQYSDLMPELAAFAAKGARLADFIRRWVPNWSGAVEPEKAWAVTAEGIPLAFVPRAEIVDELVAAEDRDARLEIVRRSKNLILNDCREVLQPDEDDPRAESISMLQGLLLEVLDVLEAGYVASACALGFSVVDSALRRTSNDTFSYQTVRATSISTKLQEAVAENYFRVSLAMRPLDSLLKGWHPEEQTPQTMPSRGAVAHWAEPGHLSETNAVIIAMAATSLFLGLNERETIGERLAKMVAG